MQHSDRRYKKTEISYIFFLRTEKNVCIMMLSIFIMGRNPV